MKKIIFIILMLVLSINLFAENYIDVVYLHNGSIIKGTIIENIFNESIKIETADGSIFIFDYDEVLKLEREIAEEPVEIGDYYGGGIVFYIDNEGLFYVCTPTSYTPVHYFAASNFTRNLEKNGYTDW